jgi:rhodanese-related sulfurtransferase
MFARHTIMVVVGFLLIITVGCLARRSAEEQVPMITPEELKAMLGNPDVVIVDVRTQADWKRSDLEIKGAIREDPEAFATWAGKLPKDKTLVFYCA